jgi:SlyX protein
MHEARITSLEEKLAHQELALAELHGELVHQQEAIRRLERLCTNLGERLRGLHESGSPTDPADERPPHY